MSAMHTDILGIMSGTSLDGLDLALCRFYKDKRPVSFELLGAETIAYNNVWKERLSNVFNASAEQYFTLNTIYGKFIADAVSNFLSKNNRSANYIASHGHTVFHRPQLGFTTQIGCGATIAAHTGISTICDFRSLDVALNGQGAPLVPIGDRDLFPDHEACLNIGGIANFSFTKNGLTKAFDICIANMALNYLAEQNGKAYDDRGKMAAAGHVDQHLLHKLLQLNTHQQSLGREFFEQSFLPLLQQSLISVEDKSATCVYYIATHINHVLQTNKLQSVLITGGGAYNEHLIHVLKTLYSGKLTIPNDDIIQFKEAIIFAYLGFLRIEHNINTLSSVTAATKDSVGGCIYNV